MDTREYWSGSDIVFNCLVDKKRVLALRNAIKKIVRKGDVVADLGTGSGILAMFAADAGAKKVYAIEADNNLYKTLETNFQINGHQKKIQLIKGDVRKIKVPEKVDVVICEMVATGLIDEIQVLAMNHFLKFTKKSTKIIPSAMHNYVDLVFNNNYFYGHKLNVVRYEYAYDKELKSKPFSDKFLYSEVNFRKLNGIKIDNSKIFVDNLRENVKRGLRQKIRNGVWPGWAPVGYLNNAKTRGIDVDSEKATKVRKMFEMYATGAYTLHALANWCKEKGLRGNLGKEIALSNVQSILQNIFYIGLMKYGGEIHEGQHEPLISKKLFDSCQEVMSKRGRVHEVHKNDFAFLGLLKCASCGASITAEKQKGHNYYRCTKKKGLCQEKHYLREEALTEQIKSFLKKVSLPSQDM